MNQLDDAKRRYDETPIPEELSIRIQGAKEQFEGRKEVSSRIGFRGGRKQFYKWGLGTAAAFLITFTAVLNTNTAFAEEVHQLPVVGAIARILTVSSYKKSVGDEKISVEVPELEFIQNDTHGLSKKINEEIREICSQYADESLERAEEYKQAFLDTGGTEAEWAEHKIEIKVWYEIKAQNDAYLSFAVKGTESWTSAYSQEKYYNIDLKSEKLLTLKDVLGEDYISKANESIKSQIEEKSRQLGIPFWTPEEGGFETISNETKFYIKDNGNPVIVFDKYEIAPGAAGAVEFEVKR
ncbi:RsiV family protein [Lacrimispora indolis]|uniref:RsiV family protein n=1 Tax=Lacrimispora indolis TaxID=69825 RepID=UPI0003F7386B|nr:RsiV family protein [[Clostridium] methoxybenzovorans]